MFLFILFILIGIIYLFIINKSREKMMKEIKLIDRMTEIQIDKNIYVFNCVYDYRIKSIRLFIFSAKKFPSITCILAYNGWKIQCNYTYKSYKIFLYPYGHLIISSYYKEYPKYVILNDKLIHIYIPYQGNIPVFNISMCICKMVNYTAVNRFIQTIESYRLFGVDHFTIYLISASKKIMKVISYYQKINVIELILSNNTFMFNKYIKNLMYGQIPKGDDCIYRNMKRSKAVIVADLDEIIWPVKHKTITEMIESYNKSYNYFSFRSFQFHTEVVNVFDRWNHDIPDADIFLYREYCRFSKGMMEKNLYSKLDAIYSIFVHWLMDGTNDLKRIDVPYDVVYIRHTRRLKYLKEKLCETNWTYMPLDSRETEINKLATKIRNILHINPPHIIKPPKLKKDST